MPYQCIDITRLPPPPWPAAFPLQFGLRRYASASYNRFLVFFSFIQFPESSQHLLSALSSRRKLQRHDHPPLNIDGRIPSHTSSFHILEPASDTDLHQKYLFWRNVLATSAPSMPYYAEASTLPSSTTPYSILHPGTPPRAPCTESGR